MSGPQYFDTSIFGQINTPAATVSLIKPASRLFMERLIRFLNIDLDARRDAAAIWPLIESRVEPGIDTFYSEMRRSDPALPLSDQLAACLKARQKANWRALFESRLDQQYFNNASLIGINHCEIGLDPKWYIAGYMRIKRDFSHAILDSSLPPPTAANLVTTLDKYVALDMALAISSYASLLVD